MITCPFCQEDDFDEIGLKIHLECYCEKYLMVQSRACGTPSEPDRLRQKLADIEAAIKEIDDMKHEIRPIYVQGRIYELLKELKGGGDEHK
jgi:hypothetical protein